ncbi:hypothetical protein BHE74_00011142 [Ensete ventricosum]|nr:hypothetical protein BHE74_00011142 [Ensete ventricosum]
MKLTKVLLQVPYFASTFVILGVFIHPCVSSFLCTDMFLLIRSIVSKKVRSNEQVLLITHHFSPSALSLHIEHYNEVNYDDTVSESVTTQYMYSTCSQECKFSFCLCSFSQLCGL